MTYRCPLGGIQPQKMDAERVKADAFHEDGILVIDLNKDPMTWDEREQFRQWGERRYGKGKTS